MPVTHTPAPSYPDAQLVATWLKGWTLARGTAAPKAEMGGLSVAVNWPQQLKRYVFARPDEGFRQLASDLYTPWVFLKVCASAEAIRPFLPSRWIIQPPGYMMLINQRMHTVRKSLPDAYRLELTGLANSTLVQVLTMTGAEAAAGRVVLHRGYAIYDRISTASGHQRQGLATIVMKTLETLAHKKGIAKGMLVATGAGKQLYEKLGWQVYTPYTSAVIPG